MCGEGSRVRSCGIPPFANSAKDGAPERWVVGQEVVVGGLSRRSVKPDYLNNVKGPRHIGRGPFTGEAVEFG
jgi:hypothetical protein